MKLFCLCIFFAVATAAVTEIKVATNYLPPQQQEKTVSDKAVVAEPAATEAATAVLGDDGYQYKTVRRLKYRQRRDVSEISSNYLPPTAGEVIAEDAVPEDAAQVSVVREYLPPTEDIASVVAEIPEAAQDTAVLSDDGYHYKTVRRLRYRQRREVANEYLPTAEKPITEVKEVVDEPQDSAVLGQDGYQYKTVRRLKYRQRRDVSELANEYLPPAEETVEEKNITPSEDTAVEAAEVVDAPQDSAVLGQDGYQYKTVRRLKYRQRRDVSELANKYLPPAEAAVEEENLAPSEDTATEVADAPQDSAVLGQDGYQYKTVRRLKYRQRRDVTEIANEYLPPAEETVEEKSITPSEDTATEVAKVVEGPQDSAVLGQDGYQYKVVRRLKYRQRRDVAEVVNEYLPPAEEAVEEENLTPSEDTATEADEVVEGPQDSAVLGQDGYQYKVVRRLKYRQRRDVAEIANEYLPPAEEAVEEENLAPSENSTTEANEVIDEPQDTAVLGQDGYQYKTVRRLKYRQRRDVSEIVQLNSDYLPPSSAAVIDIPVLPADAQEAGQDTAVLNEDGYHYKQPLEALSLTTATDVAPTLADDTIVVDVPEESGELSRDAGYQYRVAKLRAF